MATTPAGQPPRTAASLAKANPLSLIAAGLVAVCVVLTATTGSFLLAFLPAFVAFRAVQVREPLAWPVLVAAVGLVVWQFVA